MNSGKKSLPANPKIKDINQLKKQLNWGEMSAFYHMVSSSVGEVEGVLTHGFDNALRLLVNRNQWNLESLGGYETQEGRIVCDGKPKLALHQSMNERGFELIASPIIQDRKVDHFIRDHRLLEYKMWDPTTMGRVVRINQLNKFIDLYFRGGDQADLALIKYASRLVDGIIVYLQKHVDVVEISGITIRDYFGRVKSAAEQDELDELFYMQNKDKL